MSWQIPVKTNWMKTQEDHKPSMDYAKDIHKVASRMSKDFTAVEIGGAWGFSTLAILAAGAKTLETIDPNTQAQCKNESEANGYTNHVWNVRRSQDYWSDDNTKVDLIYVDGSHLYDDVRNDMYEAWKQLNPDGMLLADDWDHKNNRIPEEDHIMYGVSLACWEFWRDHPEVKNVGIDGRVLWFQK